MPMQGFDKEEPSFSHYVCRDGFWWHHEPKRRACYQGRTHLSCAELEALFYGPAIDRGEAIAKLTAGSLLSIFPEDCAQNAHNGRRVNHRTAAESLARVSRAITSPKVRARARLLATRFVLPLATRVGATDQETEIAQLLECAKAKLA